MIASHAVGQHPREPFVAHPCGDGILHSPAYHYASRDGVDSILSLGLFPGGLRSGKADFFFPLAHLFDYLYEAPGVPWGQRKRKIPEHGKTCPYTSLWMLGCCFTAAPDLSPTSASSTGPSSAKIIAIVTPAWISTK